MALDGIAVFAIAYAIVEVTPGPGLAALIGQILVHGMKAVPVQALGIYIGDHMWYALAATGLAALAHASAEVFLIVKWIGAAYLVWLAYRMWTTEPLRLETAAARRQLSNRSLFRSSLMVTLSNPKAIVFYLAVLPAIVDLRELSLPGLEFGTVIIAVIPLTVLGLYAIAARAARCLFRSPRALHTLNRISGATIAGAAIAIAARS